MVSYSLEIFVFIVAVAATNAVNLPDYFQKCNLSDSSLNTCLTKSANDAWSLIAKGDVNVHIQPLNPLNVPNLYFPISKNFEVNMSNLVLSGLEDTRINDIKLDQEKKTFDINFLVPAFNLYAFYDVDAVLLNVPVKGQGIGNCTLINMDNHLHFEYKLKEKKGKQFIEIINNSMECKISLATIQMDVLGEMLNQFLNENWEIIYKESAGPVGRVFGALFTEILKPFFKKVSFEELFSN